MYWENVLGDVQELVPTRQSDLQGEVGAWASPTDMVFETVGWMKWLREDKWDPGQRPGEPQHLKAMEEAADGQPVRWKGTRQMGVVKIRAERRHGGRRDEIPQEGQAPD